MLKARAADHIFLGLSEINMQRLRDGRPIRVDLTELGSTGIVIIYYGQTEAKMRDDLIDMVGPNTVFKDELPKDS